MLLGVTHFTNKNKTLCGRESEGMTAMLFSSEGGDAKCCIIRRRLRVPSRAIDVERFSQVLWGSAADDLIAKTSYFVFNALFYGKLALLLEKRFGIRMRSSVLSLDKTVIFFCFCTARRAKLRVLVFHTPF